MELELFLYPFPGFVGDLAYGFTIRNPNHLISFVGSLSNSTLAIFFGKTVFRTSRSFTSHRSSQERLAIEDGGFPLVILLHSHGRSP